MEVAEKKRKEGRERKERGSGKKEESGGRIMVVAKEDSGELSQQMCTFTVRVEEMETREKTEAGAADSGLTCGPASEEAGCKTLAPMLSLLFDIKEFAEQVEAQMIELNENAIMEAYFCLGHTVQGLYRNLCNRQTTIQLRAEREASPGRHTAVRAAQLDFVEADTVRSDVLDRWFPEFEELKTGQNLKHAARRGTREYSTKESLKGAGCGRQRTGSLLGAGRGADEMGGRVARSLRPRGIARDVTEKQLEFLGEEMQKGPKDGGVHESDTKIAREQSLSQCRSPGPTSGGRSWTSAG
ncbi:hypothetical protein CYMTET_51541 [Cymbomonas tetramitiformis]|uniref:Uncharacterized protein n=1 Tax=Cymbomonas tetramitiformis TaxID=36881 RepID=A0AAE0BMA6_9CHLO|nr:hypothetical protein CYMTET_51541 [Cymbomonas tetramitiformis]